MRLLRILRALRPTISRYPLVLLTSAVAAMMVFFSMTERSWKGYYIHGLVENHGLRIIISTLTGISLLIGMNMLGQHMKNRCLTLGAGAVFILMYGYLLPDNTLMSKAHTLKYWVLGIGLATHLWVAVSPYLFNRNKAHFWSYNQSLFVSIVTTALFTGVLTGGLILAVTAVANLFDIDISSNLYNFILSHSGILGSTLIFLLLIDDGLPTLEGRYDYPPVLRFLVQYILIPLLLIYALIFYAYIIKIAVAWELPKGYLSYLVLAYSIVGILSYLLVYPLRDSTEHRWVAYFSDIYYYTLIPLIVMLFVAIYTRVHAYGITENRYIIMVLAWWLVSVVGVMLWTKGRFIFYIPVSLLACTLFSLFVPYANMFSTSIRSQKSQLSGLLDTHNLVRNGELVIPENLDADIAKSIRGTYRYLNKRGADDFLEKATGIAPGTEGEGVKKLQSMLGDDRTNHESINLFLASENGSSFHSVDGYEYLIDKVTGYSHHQHVLYDNIYVEWLGSSHELVVEKNGKRDAYELKPYLDAVIKKYMSNPGTHFDVQDLSWKIELNGLDICIDIFSCHPLYKGADTHNIDGKIWIRMAESE